jgi:hypothetical protein
MLVKKGYFHPEWGWRKLDDAAVNVNLFQMNHKGEIMKKNYEWGGMKVSERGFKDTK